MSSLFKRNLALFLFLVAIGLPFMAQATFVTPKRVNIEDRQRAKALTLFNRTDKTLIYSFEWQRRAQLPGGARKLLKEGDVVEGYRPADDMLTFSPRQVVVKPNSSQKLRIFAKRPADLPDGEYHSHILLKPEPLEQKKKALEAQDSPNREGLHATFKVRNYIAVPIFVRHGETNIDFEIIEATATQVENKDTVIYTLMNNSTRSFYAREEAACKKADGTEELFFLGTARVYSEGKDVRRELPLKREEQKFSNCTGLELRLTVVGDFEIKKDKPFKTFVLK